MLSHREGSREVSSQGGAPALVRRAISDLDLDLLASTGLRPGTLVVQEQGYRAADPFKAVIALTVRCAMQSELAEAATSQLSNAHKLEKIGVWPQSDRASERVPYVLHVAVSKLLTHVKWFSVEDEASLEVFVRACARAIDETGQDDATGDKARQAAHQYLFRMQSVALEVLREAPNTSSAGGAVNQAALDAANASVALDDGPVTGLWEPRIVSKAEAEEVLAALTVKRRVTLPDFLSVHRDAAVLCAEQLNGSDGLPAMVQGLGSDLPSIFPSTLAAQPFWYLRLPEEWAEDVPFLLAREAFDNYCGQHPRNPWNVGQWLALYGRHVETEEWSSRRNLRFDEDVLGLTLRAARDVIDGVVVFIECAGAVFVTAYPLDELLFTCLSAGGAASFRRATFDHTVALLQAQTRDVIEGRNTMDPHQPAVDVYTLPHDGAPGHWGVWWHPWSSGKAVPSRENSGEAAVVGKLQHIADYLPADLADDENVWLKLPVPAGYQGALDRGELEVGLLRARGVPGCADGSIGGLVVTGKSLIHRVDLFSEEERAAASSWMSGEVIRVALEAPWTGYLSTVVFDGHDSADWVTEEELERLIEASETTVDIFHSELLDAHAWQVRQVKYAEGCEGPAGGLVSLLT